MKITKELMFDERWNDYVQYNENDDACLMLCKNVAQELFGLTDLKIEVTASNEYGELDNAFRLFRGDDGHWFLETDVMNCQYGRHYIYADARQILEPLFEGSVNGALYVKARGLDDES